MVLVVKVAVQRMIIVLVFGEEGEKYAQIMTVAADEAAAPQTIIVDDYDSSLSLSGQMHMMMMAFYFAAITTAAAQIIMTFHHSHSFRFDQYFLYHD